MGTRPFLEERCGQRARAGLLVDLTHRPELLVLDKPSSGLDPMVRRDILDAIIRNTPPAGHSRDSESAWLTLGFPLLFLQFSFVPLIILQFAIGISIAQGPMSRLFAWPITVMHRRVRRLVCPCR